MIINTLKTNLSSSDVRTKRDFLLNRTDYLMASDNPGNLSTADKNTLKAYRQDLRDVPQQQAFTDGDYDNITYPNKPEFL